MTINCFKLDLGDLRITIKKPENCHLIMDKFHFLESRQRKKEGEDDDL